MPGDEAPSDRADKKERKRHAMACIGAVAAILRRWNPMGIDGLPANEYDTCAGHIVKLVAGGCSVDDLARHLVRLRSDLSGIPAADDERVPAAEIIAAVRDAAP